MTNAENMSALILQAGERIMKVREARMTGLENIVAAVRKGLMDMSECHAELDRLEMEYTKGIEEVNKILGL